MNYYAVKKYLDRNLHENETFTSGSSCLRHACVRPHQLFAVTSLPSTHLESAPAGEASKTDGTFKTNEVIRVNRVSRYRSGVNKNF